MRLLRINRMGGLDLFRILKTIVPPRGATLNRAVKKMNTEDAISPFTGS